MSLLKPLIIIAVFITASGFTSDILGDYLGPIEYQGYLVFDYPEGENPIINIVFTIDPTIADNLIIVDVPSIWSYSYASPALTLSDGSVSPGESVRVTVSLNRYFEGGEYATSSLGITSAGEMSYASGPLLVGELYLLNFLRMASIYRYPLAGISVGLFFLGLLLPRRKLVGSDDLQRGRATVDTVYDVDGGTTRVVDDLDNESLLRSDAMGRVIEPGFSEASGLEVEVPEIDYRTGTDSDSSPRKLSGLDKFTNITMKRGDPESPDVETLRGDEHHTNESPIIREEDGISFTSGSGESSDEIIDTVDEDFDAASDKPDTPTLPEETPDDSLKKVGAIPMYNETGHSPSDSEEPDEFEEPRLYAWQNTKDGSDMSVPQITKVSEEKGEHASDIEEYDDSDLPGLDNIDESGIDSPSDNTSDNGTVNDEIPYTAPPERKYKIRVRVQGQNGNSQILAFSVTLKEYPDLYKKGAPIDGIPIWDPSQSYLDYRRYWYERFGEWFDKEFLQIQNDPERLRNLVNYVDTYAPTSTVTRARANVSKEDREYDEQSFSKHFKDAIDDILETGDTQLFRKYLGHSYAQ